MSYPNNIPRINVTGKWELRAPFDKLINPNGTYKCDSVKGFVTLANIGIQVEARYYAPHGLSTATYKSDDARDVKIVCLLGNDGSKVYVPTTYIIRAPNEQPAAYYRIILSFDLGILPDWLDLSTEMGACNELLQSALGILPAANIHKGPAEGFVSLKDAEAAESMRIAGIELDTLSKVTSEVAKDKAKEKAEKANTALKSIVTKFRG